MTAFRLNATTRSRAKKPRQSDGARAQFDLAREKQAPVQFAKRSLLVNRGVAAIPHDVDRVDAVRLVDIGLTGHGNRFAV
jgi:hypothetical protein